MSFDGSQALEGKYSETIKGYLKVDEWNSTSGILDVTIWLYDSLLSKWTPIPVSIQYLAGNYLDFIGRAEGELDGSYGFIFQFKVKTKKGAFSGGSISTLGSYMVSTGCTIDCTGPDDGSGWAGRIDILGSCVTDTKVPQDLRNTAP